MVQDDASVEQVVTGLLPEYVTCTCWVHLSCQSIVLPIKVSCIAPGRPKSPKLHLYHKIVFIRLPHPLLESFG